MSAKMLGMFIVFLANGVVAEFQIIHGQMNEQVNLNSYWKCNKRWIKNYNEVDNEFNLIKDTISLYYCPDPKRKIFLFAIDKTLSFDVTVPEPPMVGSNVDLSCSVSFWANIDKIDSEVTILRGTDLLVNKVDKDLVNKKHDVEANHSFLLNKSGSQTFICSWKYSYISVDKELFENTDVKNISIEVFSPPRNVKLNDSSIKIIEGNITAQVNKSITCTSEAHPSPNYSWSCSGNKWISQVANITFYASSVYNCSCEVENIIKGQLYHSSWNGIIHVVSEDEFKLIGGENPDNRRTVGLAVGITLTLLFIITVVSLAAWKLSKKSKRQVSSKSKEGNQGKTPETEHFEVFDNQLYGKVGI